VHHLFGRSAFEAAPFPIAAATWLFEKAIPSAYRNLPIVAVSASTREDLSARGMNQDRIEVIENGVDPIYFSLGEEDVRYPLPRPGCAPGRNSARIATAGASSGKPLATAMRRTATPMRATWPAAWPSTSPGRPKAGPSSR
jgi:hypothetical protein